MMFYGVTMLWLGSGYSREKGKITGTDQETVTCLYTKPIPPKTRKSFVGQNPSPSLQIQSQQQPDPGKETQENSRKLKKTPNK